MERSTIVSLAPLGAGLLAAALSYRRRGRAGRAALIGAATWLGTGFALGFVRALQGTTAGIAQAAVTGAGHAIEGRAAAPPGYHWDLAGDMLVADDMGFFGEPTRSDLQATAEGRPATPGAPPPSTADIIAAKAALRGVRRPQRMLVRV